MWLPEFSGLRYPRKRKEDHLFLPVVNLPAVVLSGSGREKLRQSPS
jgi:hypothetical protein